MGIISASLDEKTEKKLDEIMERGSFSGRSELIRKLIQDRLQNMKMEEGLTGKIHGVIVVRHGHEKEDELSNLSHSHDSIINTRLHEKISGEECLEVYLAEGPAGEVLEFYSELEGSRATKSVELIPQD